MRAMPARAPLAEAATRGKEPSGAEIERLFEMATDLLATADGRGRFTHLNPAWERTLGWKVEELMSRSIFDFVHPDDIEQTRQLATPATRSATRVVNFANRYRHKDGGWRWL